MQQPPPQQGGQQPYYPPPYGGYPPPPQQGGGYPPYYPPPPQQGGYPPYYPPPPQQGGGYPPYYPPPPQQGQQQEGGGGYPPQYYPHAPYGGYPPPPQQGGQAPIPQQGAPPPQQVKLDNVWKISWDADKSHKTAPKCRTSDDRLAWFKENPSFDMDCITCGNNVIEFWNMDYVKAIKEHQHTGEYARWENVALDVIESERKMIIGLRPTFESTGTMIMAYNLDTGAITEVRKDMQEGQWITITCTRGGSPTLIGTDRWTISMFDVETGRPLGTIKPPRSCLQLTHDKQDPNLFYAPIGDTIYAYDKRSKSQARAFLGLKDDVLDVNSLEYPTGQLIGNDNTMCKIWDVGSGREIHSIENLRCAGKSYCHANVVAVAELDGTKVYDLQDGQGTKEPVRVLKDPTNRPLQVTVTPKKIIVRGAFWFVSTPFG